MAMIVTEPLEPYDSIRERGLLGFELNNVESVVRDYPLSGYLGGQTKGGYWVERLEAQWCEAFGCRYAVAMNSATSGLLAACVAAGIQPGDGVITTPYSMSATAAAPKLLGAEITFADIELNHYCLDPGSVRTAMVTNPARAIIATNLFGHPAELRDLRAEHRAILIEDNAQAPFASEYGAQTGTIGHMGVYSLNVHKHFQTGEGGIVTTNSLSFAEALMMFRNHGEMADGAQVGLNLRMTEVTAAIACAQLARGRDLVNQRVDIAEAIINEVREVPGIWVPAVRANCRHVYYCLPFFVDNDQVRNKMIEALRAEGVPLQTGYVRPLYHLTAFRKSFAHCPNAEKAHKRIMLYENCAWTPTTAQIKQFGEAFKKVADHVQAMEASEVSEG